MLQELWYGTYTHSKCETSAVLLRPVQAGLVEQASL
nr:MAG TPA: hypothetical protein [Caudoviricetes sp.]